MCRWYSLTRRDKTTQKLSLLVRHYLILSTQLRHQVDSNLFNHLILEQRTLLTCRTVSKYTVVMFDNKKD